jgi:hypothetical protein
VTRSHKYNDRDHTGGMSYSLSSMLRLIMVEPPADCTVHVESVDEGINNIPKYFAKHGFADTDPKKIKKNGGGKGNWYVCFPFVIRTAFHRCTLRPSARPDMTSSTYTVSDTTITTSARS